MSKEDIGIHIKDSFLAGSLSPEPMAKDLNDPNVIPMEEALDDEDDEERIFTSGEIKRLCVLFNDAPIAAYMAEKLPKVKKYN